MEVQIREHNLGNYIIPEDVIGGKCVDIGSNVGSFFSEWSNARIDFSWPATVPLIPSSASKRVPLIS